MVSDIFPVTMDYFKTSYVQVFSIKSPSTKLVFHITCLSGLFWSLCFAEPDLGKNSCFVNYQKNKGHHLNSAVYKAAHASVETDCGILCAHEQCCRSFNYKKDRRVNEIGNCELLHDVGLEKPWLLEKNQVYDNYRLIEPSRPFNCSCVPCMNSETCEANSKECKCLPGFSSVQCERAKSCEELYNQGKKKDGIYLIDPDGQGLLNVTCDMTTDGGGWTVIQMRLDGSVNFARNWTDYKNGFGDLKGEFWLGLDKIHRMTESGKQILRVDLKDFDSNTRHAKYLNFTINSEDSQYSLTISGYSGDAGDSFSSHNGMKFTTMDRDNDKWKKNCATLRQGAWWYNKCHQANLNGLYYHDPNVSHGHGIQWAQWKGKYYSLKKSVMKLRSN